MPWPSDIQTLRADARRAFYAGDLDLMSRLLSQAISKALVHGDSVVIHRLAHTASDLFNRAGAQLKSLEMALLALEHKQIEGQEDFELANYACFLARQLGRMGKPSEGILYAERGLQLFAKLAGPDHQETRMVRLLLQRLKAETPQTH